MDVGAVSRCKEEIYRFVRVFNGTLKECMIWFLASQSMLQFLYIFVSGEQFEDHQQLNRKRKHEIRCERT
ncbi:hypothetical protein CW712_00805 [Candidatus Bathyarchaeota archaeon]|nr:MAG: hypothetical protein CW712_00805 [Candidatus Bathyarchaeota archaeon]